jgi:hypothetical protein
MLNPQVFESTYSNTHGCICESQDEGNWGSNPPISVRDKVQAADEKHLHIEINGSILSKKKKIRTNGPIQTNSKQRTMSELADSHQEV